MRRATLVWVALCCGACSTSFGDARGAAGERGAVSEDEYDGDPEADPFWDEEPEEAPVVEDAPTIAWVAPATGATLAQTDVVAGSWVAKTTLRVEARGVNRVSYYLDGRGELAASDTPPFAVDVAIPYSGNFRVIARGLRDGMFVSSATVEISVTPPEDASCHAKLRTLALPFVVGDESRGVEDPVLVGPAIRGVSFHYSRQRPAAMLVDCEFATRLVELADFVRARGVDEVIHLGTYNYRCIGGGDPDVDDCEPSEHAYGNAIDIAGFGLAGSTTEARVLRDWVIGPSAETCPAPTPAASTTTPTATPTTAAARANQLLHDIACGLARGRPATFNTILTPNYNAAHRDHLHADVQPGSMYGWIAEDTSDRIDPPYGGLGDEPSTTTIDETFGE